MVAASCAQSASRWHFSMNMAVSIPRSHRAAAAVPPQPDAVRVDIFEDFAAAEPVWRALERGDCLATPYQRFDFLRHWQAEVGQPGGVRPLLVTGADEHGEPVFLLPLGRTQRGSLRIVEFLGGTHTNFNAALWRRDAVAATTPKHANGIVRAIAARTQADVLLLNRLPVAWEGVANPLAALPHQRSVQSCTKLTLAQPGATLLASLLSSAMRGRLRTKERKLQKQPGYRYHVAASAADIDRLLAAFLALKRVHMAQEGLHNVFDDPGMHAFLRAACQAQHGGGQLIEIHTLECDDEVLALFACISDGRRASAMFNTYTLSDNARQSPGLIILLHMIENYADRGFKTFDLGIGAAQYKSFFCNEPEPLFDCTLPLSTRGVVAAAALRLGSAVKREIRRSPMAWKLVATARRLRGSLSQSGD
jgi:CelD/BcsL family acetyltransferase involved in cellulose biosynthesis